MNRFPLILLAFPLLFIAPLLRAQQHPITVPATVAGYEDLYREMLRLRPDSSQVARVSNLTLRRDAATFNLASGTIVLCSPVAGRIVAAVFVGEGSYEFIPPTDVERKHLARFYRTEVMKEPLRTMFMVFADGTLDELRGSLAFGPGAVPPEAAKAIGNGLPFITSTDARSLDDEFAAAFLNGERNDLFFTQMEGTGDDPKFFEISPYSREEVLFMRRGQVAVSTFREPVVMAHLQSEYAAAPKDEDKRFVDMEAYVVDAAFAGSLESSITADVTFRPLKDGMRWINFHLYPELVIDSMFWADGSPATFYDPGTSSVWVLHDAPMVAGEQQRLRVHYHGSLLFRQVDWILLKSSIGWYPTHDSKDKATFDLTFRTPAYLKIAAVGSRVSAEERGDMLTTRWVVDAPIRNASFNIGVFQQQDFTPEGVAPITVYRGEGSSSGAGEQIGWDVENSIKFYEYLYGRLPFEHFYATEIPAYHGEAFPGLIHLSFATFGRNEKQGRHEIFRAHEVAHQWWGIGVDFKTYHDQWLSEGFSEYSGLMYMQAVLKDNEKFFRRMDEYRWELINNRKSFLVESPKSGPIWLGYRTSSSTTEGDYNLVIYKKGAWVLHMLRNLLLDLNTMKEDKYLAMMREFFSTYNGSSASTEDFRRVVEKHAGMNMGWFFNQWVYNTGIPTYRYSYAVEDAPGGKYRVNLRVVQENVPDDFQMYVPVKLDFGDGRAARVRVLVRGPRSEPQLPLMPLRPEKLIFNDLESVLCEVESADWE